MSTTASYLAYAPRGAGLLCALFYAIKDEHVYGWYSGAKDTEFPASFFMLEHFYSSRATAFYRTRTNDVYGDWFIRFSPIEQRLDPPGPVPEEMRHELVRLQDRFARHCLFYRDDPHAEAESAAYQAMELAVQDVNVRCEQFSKFDKGDAVWVFATRDIDLNLVEYLKQDWQLDYN
jgi:hypothetical protein